MKFALFIQYFGASMSFGSLAQKKVLRSMELFAQGVMPKFRSEWVRVWTRLPGCATSSPLL